MLSFVDHRRDPAGWARQLGISQEAVELYLGSDVIDLHIDSYIWTRLFGYDLHKRHGQGLLGGRVYSQVDFPRVLEASLSGAAWVITTNPARTTQGRARAFSRNLRRLQQIVEGADDQLQCVRNAAEYRAARASGKHAVFVAVQGGSALDQNLEALDLDPDGLVLLITLLHLYSSSIGTTSAPLGGGSARGLSDFGRRFVEELNRRRIFVDLAHVSRRGFYDALEVHDKSQPVLVSHTGIAGVYDHWRNLDDAQLRAVADTGGTVGVMYHASFLGDSWWRGRASCIVDHLEHIVKVVGDQHASLGSDWDGAIATPRDMPTCLELPRLVQRMLDRGWSADRIQRILGQNFLRTLEALRG